MEVSPVSPTDPIVFLLDVDNTLLDNDQIVADLRRHLTQAFGAECQERYWTIFDKHRNEVGYADYLAALQQYRAENPREPQFLEVSFFLLEYPFADRLYPGALDVVAKFNSWGRSVILSDGDVIFQPRKIERSGLYKAAHERALVYIHKEEQLDDVEARHPARHYVMVDDKLRLLHAFKKVWGSRVTTVFPRQGHYAPRPEALVRIPARGRHGRADRRSASVRPGHVARRGPYGRRRAPRTRSIQGMINLFEEASPWLLDTTIPSASCHSTIANRL